ncbi:MAG: 4Fe-4S binding protein [Clostridia bacterium]|nr:4Fe-4S binding protein [Clostridia bacterium]
MNTVFEKNRCCGCSACSRICPVGAITMVEDGEGFLYPEINQEKCIQCGACHRICAFNTQIEKQEIGKVYAVQNKEEELRNKATSGGFFHIIASYTIKNGGVVYGAALNEELVVEHQRAEKQEELEKFYGSKYVQSDLHKIYESLLRDIKENRLVLFTGTPCQVAEVRQYYQMHNGDIKRLITCDFVCHGVPSRKIFKEHIQFLEKEYKKKIVSYKFRTKDYGWKGHHEKAIFEGGEDTEKSHKECVDIYKELYGSLNIIRPSCYECPYAKSEHISDMTMGDFWGIENYEEEFKDNKGTSFVMINSQQGQKIFEELKEEMIYKEEKIEICRNPQLKGPTSKPKNREKFWNEYSSKGYKYIAKKYTTYGLVKKARVTAYQILKKMKLK